jgi:hypothetical protein
MMLKPSDPTAAVTAAVTKGQPAMINGVTTTTELMSASGKGNALGR